MCTKFKSNQDFTLNLISFTFIFISYNSNAQNHKNQQAQNHPVFFSVGQEEGDQGRAGEEVGPTKERGRGETEKGGG